MILAAGFGTRFLPATRSIPKSLIPLCNRPLIGWAVESLLEHGINEIVVNLHHLPDPIRAWLDREYGARVPFHYSVEEKILGTGGGLIRCKKKFVGEDVFVLLNGDTVQFPPYDDLVAAIERSAAAAAMLVRRPPPGDSFTGVWLVGNEISAIGDQGRGLRVMFAGVHALTPAIFDKLPDRNFSGLTEDLYLPMLDRGDTIAAALGLGFWFDIGTPLRYMEASREMIAMISEGRLAAPRGTHIQQLQQVLVDASAVIEGQVLKSVVGPESVVCHGSQIVDSAIWSRVSIGANAVVESSIIADGVVISPRSVVQNALVCTAVAGGENDPETRREGQLLIRSIDPGIPVVYGVE